MQTKLGNFIAQNLGAYNLTLVQKGSSALTTTADLDNTLVTKSYVDAQVGGNCQFFSVGQDCNGHYCDLRGFSMAGGPTAYETTTAVTADKICQDKGYGRSSSFRSKDCSSSTGGAGTNYYYWSGTSWRDAGLKYVTCYGSSYEAANGERLGKIDYVNCCK